MKGQRRLFLAPHGAEEVAPFSFRADEASGIGDTSETGVVDHKGEVFGYPNLFVSDGAIMPRPIGRNPAKTIAALAERNVELMNAS